jgi:adenosylcobyric acid synthase
MKMTKCLMVQGTTSDAGKSALVAGICRVLSNQNKSVAPFKPQNMALNSAVTTDGGEIGRAQAVQAQAARIEPTVHMNPILLKPESDKGAQVIVQGKPKVSMSAIGYGQYKDFALPSIIESFEELKKSFEYVIIEGAGSPAEINLRKNDVANMGFAEEADVPVIIVADIDKGGVFAHLWGTLNLLSESEQKRVKGFVINKFRGDMKLLESGLTWLERKSGKPVLGVVPYIHGLNLEAEDAIESVQIKQNAKLIVKVPVLPRISNHTDFDALRLNPNVDFCYCGVGESLAGADLIILPGTKSVRADLDALRENGWDKQLLKHLRFGGKVVGICGGMQILGKEIIDELGIEGVKGTSKGLGLLPLSTNLQSEKVLEHVSGTLTLAGDTSSVSGYEIHAGRCEYIGSNCISLSNGRKDGIVDESNQIFGTYLHGLFDDKKASELILRWVVGKEVSGIDIEKTKDEAIERLAQVVDSCVDLSKIWR